jgi:hypothetical protein
VPRNPRRRQVLLAAPGCGKLRYRLLHCKTARATSGYDFVRACHVELEGLREQLPQLEAEELRTGERRASSLEWVDTTPQSIATVKSAIAQIEKALASYLDRERHWRGLLLSQTVMCRKGVISATPRSG